MEIDGNGVTSSAPLRADGFAGVSEQALTIGIRAPIRRLGEGAMIDAGIVPFVPTATIAAVVAGEDLVLDDPIGRLQAAGAGAAARLLADWLGMQAPAIRAPIGDDRPDVGAEGVGLFFTRGVDSWCSLLRHRDRVTHLLYFDDARMVPTTRDIVGAENALVAGALGLPLVVLSANARDLLDRHCSWELSHGAILASTALVLAPHIGEVLVASSHVTGQARPWGTHAMLDPLWSTSTMRFVHDGGELSRWEKTELVAAHQPALDSLFVCFAGGHQNCGRCHKCLLTMTALEGVGALGRCTRFDAPLQPAAIDRLPTRPPGHNTNVRDLLRHLPPGSELAAAWARVVPPEDLEGTPFARGC